MDELLKKKMLLELESARALIKYTLKNFIDEDDECFEDYIESEKSIRELVS